MIGCSVVLVELLYWMRKLTDLMKGIFVSHSRDDGVVFLNTNDSSGR